MKAGEIHEFFQSLNGGWVDYDDTVDKFVSGNPEEEVEGIAVAWMSYTWALKEALNKGCNLFITHEPTYYSHPDEHLMLRIEEVREKQSFIEESEIIILRCHDLWDQLPEVGIPDSWAKFLGFSAPIDGDGYFRVFDVSGKTLLDVAQQVAERTKSLGQPGVQLVGADDIPVSRVCIGTGAMTPFIKIYENFKADLVICVDDGSFYCFDGAFSVDMGIPMIVVNHTVSEEPGMISMADFLREKYPQIPIHHIPQSCPYRLVVT